MHEDNQLVLTIGGDHSLAIGTIAAAAAKYGDALRILWVDAHADCNSPETSPSGNIHGMPLAFLLGLVDPKSVTGFEWLEPVISPHQVCYIGLRDVDEGEKAIVRENHIKGFSMADIDRHGIGNVMQKALDYLSPLRNNPIHLSYDIDSVDPLVAPATGTRVRGGLTYREACFLAETVAETGLTVSIDLVEVNPAIGSHGDVAETASVAVSILRSAVGQTIV